MILLISTTLGVLISGCPRPPPAPVVYAATRGYTADDYPEALRRWTRRAEIYDQFQSLSFVDAVFKTPDFRKAYAAAYAKIMDLTPAEATRMWVEETAAAASWHEIVAIMHTTDRKWNDLDNPGSIWKIRLSSPETGADEHPSAVTVVRDFSPQMQRLFPQLSPFTKCYILRFPRKDAAGAEVVPSGGGRSILTLTSGLGKAEVEWNISH